MTGNELIALLRAGKQLDIQFLEGIEEQEGYAEAGMRGVIRSAHSFDDDLVKVDVDFSPYAQFNRAIESSSWYDSYGQPTLTYRQKYPQFADMEAVLTSANLDVAEFKLVDSRSMAVYERFKKQHIGPATSFAYVEWLEAQVSIGTDPAVTVA